MSGWIQDGTTLFARVEGQKLHGTKLTLYSMYKADLKLPLSQFHPVDDCPIQGYKDKYISHKT